MNPSSFFLSWNIRGDRSNLGDSLEKNIFGKKLQIEFLKYGKLGAKISEIEGG